MRVWGLGLWDLGLRVEGLGLRVWGLGFRVEGLGLASALNFRLKPRFTCVLFVSIVLSFLGLLRLLSWVGTAFITVSDAQLHFAHGVRPCF